MNSTQKRRLIWLAGAILVPAAGLLSWRTNRYWPFISDDALISLRYAQRLLDGHGLTWTDGPRVEGYSNLLWTVAIAGLGKLGIDLVSAARGLGMAGMLTAMAAVVLWPIWRSPFRDSWLSAATGALTFALAAPIAVWAIGGLEQPLLAALLAVSIPAVAMLMEGEGSGWRSQWIASACLGLLCLTRPDGPLFTVAAVLALLLQAGLSRKRSTAMAAIRVLALPVVCVCGQEAFRLAYYGAWLPNPALVKLAPTAVHFQGGLNYLQAGLRSLFPLTWLTAASGVPLLFSPEARRRALFPALAAIIWAAYVVFIGGDIFPAYRHLVPLIVLGAFILAEGVRTLTTAFGSRRAMLLPVAAAMMIASFVMMGRTQSADTNNRKAITERWEWQGEELGLLLKQAFHETQPLVAVTAAGCVPYWSELPSLDMLGLNDFYLPRHPPADFGNGFIGHELGDGHYVMSQRPDLIIFTVGSEPWSRSGVELDAMPEFHQRYIPMMVRTAPSHYLSRVYVDRDSRRIGIARTPTLVSVPGYLLIGPDAVASIEDGRLVATVTPEHPIGIVLDVDVTKIWEIDEVGSRLTNGLRAEVRQSDGAATVTVRADGVSGLVTRVVLRPAAAAAGGGRFPQH